MADHGITPSQTVGPFFHYCLTPRDYGFAEIFATDIADPAAGTPIRVEGTILDGDGAPVADAFVEIWQADGQGRYTHPADPRARNSGFGGFARVMADKDGRFAFATVKPGPVPGPDGRTQAPHINVGLFGRGLLNRLHTRIYFADEAAANAADPVLALVPADARATLVAATASGGTYRFDIRLQGAGETAFFEV